jgi:uncharacterized membrane protein YdcZ (DUF606 family)
MAVWKVLIIGILACLSLGLGLATVAIPISYEGAQRWTWLGGLLGATIVVGTLFVLFLRYADASLDVKPRGSRS